MISDRQYRLLNMLTRVMECTGRHLRLDYIRERQPWFYTLAAFYMDMVRLEDLGYVAGGYAISHHDIKLRTYRITDKGRDALKGIFANVVVPNI